MTTSAIGLSVSEPIICIAFLFRLISQFAKSTWHCPRRLPVILSVAIIMARRATAIWSQLLRWQRNERAAVELLEYAQPYDFRKSEQW